VQRDFFDHPVLLAATVQNKTKLTGICWLSDNTTMILHSIDFQNVQQQPRVSIVTRSRFCLAERPAVKGAYLRELNIGKRKDGGKKELDKIFLQCRITETIEPAN
jgi:hypothetical protein